MKKLMLIVSSVIFLIIILMIYKLFNQDMFYGLQPKAIYNDYKIYDIVEQRGLACAEAIEILVSDGLYDYYFNCLKSDRIYLVNDNEIIKVKDAYKKGIISKEKLYELKILDRMQSSDIFSYLEPVIEYNEYRIYDLTKNGNHACKEGLEVLYSDEKYEYYFDCIKSTSVYFVSDIEILEFSEAVKREIVDFEELYKLNIVNRIEREYEQINID